jgi:glycosyltransferase involved in cell wall biosynthesis
MDVLPPSPGLQPGDSSLVPPLDGPSLRVRFLARTLVLIPALNESEVIESTVLDWINLGVGCVRVVDNGSVDETAALARARGADVVLEPRRGYGAACWTGLLSLPPGVDYILFSSADGSDRFVAAELPVWEQAVEEGYDLVLGNRCLYPGALASLKWLQRCGSQVASVLMRWGWRIRFHDMGSRRLIRISSFRQLALKDRGFGWNVEMQVRAVEEGLRFLELPVPYFPRRAGRSKISGNWLGSLKASWGIISTLLYLWITKSSRRR